VVWATAIVGVSIGSLLPASSLPMQLLDQLHVPDKLQHFGAYAVLAFLPALHERSRFVRCAGVGLMLLGLGLEFGQLYSPGRSVDMGDAVANAFGVCCGVILAIPFRNPVRTFFRLSTE